MQLQLSMALADKLHETLLVQGEPLPATVAACFLTAAPSCPPELGTEVLNTLVANDDRFCLVDAPSSATPSPLISLRDWEMPDPELTTVPFVALDLETTGARPGVSKITEIGAVRFEGLREVGRFNTLVNPMRPIPPMIVQITGITTRMVADAPRIEEVIAELLEFIKGAVIVAHNAGFDVNFLNYELRRLKGQRLGNGAIDTLPLARALAPGLPNYKLATVAKELGAPVTACHRALADAQAVGHVFLTLARQLQGQGITRLNETRSFLSGRDRDGLQKLCLTRGLPQRPGTYRFLDSDGQVVYIGKADSLQDQVRSHFVGTSPSSRRIRQATRLVEHVQYEVTHTPLEAVVRQQELIIQHRPPCNLHGTQPENYAYLQMSASPGGMRLLATTRAPAFTRAGQATATSRSGVAGSSTSAFLGPFRSRTRVATAVDLLQRLYPIRRCHRQPREHPCARSGTSRCLAPCAGPTQVRTEHDALVTALVDWLAGGGALLSSTPFSLPEDQVEELTQFLLAQHRYEEVRQVKKAWDDLLSIRAAYASLVEAQRLSFICLWPLTDGNGGGDLRMDVVHGGKLCRQVPLHREALAIEIEQALVSVAEGGAQPSCAPPFVAVPQQELDMLLAVRHWFRTEASKARVITLALDSHSQEPLSELRHRIVAEALRAVS